MIDFLRGKLARKGLNSAVVDVNGVGYELDISAYTSQSLPELFQEISLFTHFIVREDAHVLCGFSSSLERQLFRALIKINGIGPKSALAMLSVIDPDALIRAITSGDSVMLTRLPGVGKKTAERIVLERDRLQNDLAHDSLTSSINVTNKGQESTPRLHIAQQEAISALEALGYKSYEAMRVVHNIEGAETKDSDVLIREALKILSKKVASPA